MSTAPLDQAVTTARSVIADVKPDQLDTQSPCASWKLADVINHVIGGHHFFAALVSGEPPQREAPDFAAGDYLAAFDAAARASRSAFLADGAMERMIELPFGTMPASAVVSLLATDTLTHAWDIAKVTGQPTDLAPDLAAGLLGGVRGAIQDSFRGDDGKAPFGPECVAPEGASNADRLAAFLGRAST
ncbi:MAG: hypothetical protein QOD72_3989 [Acidimicrobiaceae bacterium]|nr:hypothetical protein [Acidimicrobiaceae bacterium]